MSFRKLKVFRELFFTRPPSWKKGSFVASDKRSFCCTPFWWNGRLKWCMHNTTTATNLNSQRTNIYTHSLSWCLSQYMCVSVCVWRQKNKTNSINHQPPFCWLTRHQQEMLRICCCCCCSCCCVDSPLEHWQPRSFSDNKTCTTTACILRSF